MVLQALEEMGGLDHLDVKQARGSSVCASSARWPRSPPRRRWCAQAIRSR
jgi:hypothetical protein